MLEMTIPASVKQEIWSIMGRIPGVSLAGMTGMSSSPGLMDVDVRFKGWTPSLHSYEFTARIPVKINQSHSRMIFEIETSLKAILDRQASRSHDAQYADIPFPIGWDMRREENSMPQEIDHLEIDVSLLGISIEQTGYGEKTDAAIWSLVRKPLGDLLLSLSCRDKTGEVMSHNDFAIREQDGRRTVDFSMNLPNLEKDKPFLLKSAGLSLAGIVLPESVLTTLVGRTVSQVASFGPLLDDRIVKDFTQYETSLRIVLEPNTIPFSQVIGLGATEMRKKVRDRIASARR